MLLAATFPARHEDPIDEPAFVRELIAGSEAAWRAFDARYGRLVVRCIGRVVARFASVASSEDVPEVYATLVAQLLANDRQKLRAFDPSRGTRFSSFVGMLALNATYDHLRSVRRGSARGSLVDAERLPSDAPDPYDLCARKQQAERIRDLLAQLSERDRDFVALYFSEGLEPDEVAARLGISVKTVYSKKHKIQSRLSALLERERLAA